MQNTQIHSVDRMQSFCHVKAMVQQEIMTTGYIPLIIGAMTGKVTKLHIS
jgi:hypothetical protein